MKKIYLISNDKIWHSNGFYTSNNDLDNILTCLENDYELNVINRTSLQKLHFKLTSNFRLVKPDQIKEKKLNFLMISITPYNFLIFLYLLIFKKKNINGFVYLRSDGFLEYKYRYGMIGYFTYFLMFKLISNKLKILSCSNNFTKVKKSKLLHPSELESKWFKKNSLKKTFQTDFLYVGRFKKDKGSHYLIKIFNEYLKKFKLTIIGNNKMSIPKKYHLSNVVFKDSVIDTDKLIAIYDSTKIFILPSYIEGFPKVISEALARLKPVIIFKEIDYVISNREGIFVTERNKDSINKTVNFILENYEKIQKKIKKNFFYTKKNFKKELLSFIKYDFK